MGFVRGVGWWWLEEVEWVLFVEFWERERVLGLHGFDVSYIL